jgi:hypothetical protein
LEAVVSSIFDLSNIKVIDISFASGRFQRVPL